MSTDSINTAYDRTVEELFTQYPAFKTDGAAAYNPGLDATKRLSALFGNPHAHLRCVHVAGTNGKGSTSHCIAAALSAAGYRTALYTSPHISDFRERMLIDGRMIARGQVVEFMERFHALVPDNRERRYSFFELTTIMAFDWFCRSAVDVAVVEVGLGGRLDSTNIITPDVSVITNISLDHTQILGSTPAQIAGEKAGIIKHGVPVVIGEADRDVRDVFIRRASEMEAPVTFASESAVSTVLLPDGRVDVDSSPFGNFPTVLHGDFQLANVRTAICTLAQLRAIGYNIPDDAVREAFGCGVARTLHGRWQMHDGVLCDSGHNTGAWRYTSRYLASRAGRLTAVLGFCADKDVDTIVDMLPQGVRYHCVAAPTPRAIAADVLAEKLRGRGLDAAPYPSVGSAIDAARANGRPEIFLGGSFYVVAEYIKSLSHNIC